MATQPITLGFVGDIIPTRAKISSFKALPKFDFLSGNLEAPLSGKPRLDKIGPLHETNKASLAILSSAGFSYLSLANNHIADQGSVGIRKTQNYLTKLGIKHSGAGQISDISNLVSYVEIKGIKMACLSLADNDSGNTAQFRGIGYFLGDDPRLKTLIKKLKNSCDLVIIHSHGGIEEVPLPPSYRITKLRQYVDWGADLVIGAHPHVAQGWESYHEGYIFYSLGDYFFNPQSTPKDPSFGMMVEITYHRHLSKPCITYFKNARPNTQKNLLLSRYLKQSSTLLHSPYLLDMITHQHHELFRIRYKQFLTQFLGQTIDFHLSPFHLRFNTRFLRLCRLLFYNPSHREVVLSPLKWLSHKRELAPYIKKHRLLAKSLRLLS